MEKLVIYYRVSTETQDEQSQLTDLIAWSKANNFEVDKVFGEKISGYDVTAEREELENLKSYVVSKGIKTVLVWELSRLGRSTLQTLQHIEFFTQHKVNVIFKKENLHTLSDNFTNKLVINLLTSIAEMERNTLVQRTRRGMINSARNNKRIGFGKMPLGYEADENGFIRINEKESKIVREMYKYVASGLSAQRVAKEFNAKGIPTYNEKMGKKKMLKSGQIVPAKWNPKTIKNIIKSTRYKGVRTFGEHTIPVPRIVDDELWAEANKKIDEHIGYISRTKYNYLAKSKITCGHCGYTLKSIRKYGKQGLNKKYREVLYYTCQSYLHTYVNCDCGRFRSEVFDLYLYKILFEHSRGLLTLIQNGSSAKEKEELRKRIDYWSGEKASAVKEKNRVLSLYKKGFIDDKELENDFSAISKRVNEAESENLRLSNSLQNLEVPEGLTMDIMRKHYWNSDFATRRAFVEEHIQRIKAYKVKDVDFDLTEVTYTSYEDRGDNKITVIKNKGFNEPKRNEVIWYVEIFAFNRPDPIKALMTSGTGTNYVNPNLSYDKEKRIISLQ